MQELISVIIPVYNVEKYIDKCVESVVRQTYENLEIWLVDDGSTDSSGKSCENWKEKDSRIHVIHQENQGVSMARNNAIDICKGNWITFVDSDDIIDIHYVEVLYGLALSYGTIIAQCREKSIEEKNVEEGEIRRKRMGSREYLLSKDFKVMAWGKIYHRQLFETERYPKVKIHEEVALTYKLVYAAESIACTNEILYFCNERPDSLNAKNRFYKEKLDILQFYKEQIKYFRNKKERELEKRSIRDYVYELLIAYNKTKDILHDKDMAEKLKKEYRSQYGDVMKDEKISLKTKILLSFCYYRPEIWKILMK